MSIQSSIIDRIIEIAIESRFGDEKRSIETGHSTLAADVYNRLVPPKIRDALTVLHTEAPGVWVEPLDWIVVDGFNRIALPEGSFRPFKDAPVASQHHFTLTVDEIKRWRDLEERDNRMRERRHEVYGKLEAFVQSFDTTAELIAAWPEGASFVEQAVFNTAGTQTAYPKTEINALLGIG